MINNNYKAEPVWSIVVRDYFWKIPTNSTEGGKAMPGWEPVILPIVVPSRSLLPTSFLTDPKRVR